jgi:hypothetical protein
MNEYLSQVADGEPGKDGEALLSVRPLRVGGLPAWPAQVRCDLIDVPVEVCCGVIAHLASADITTSAIACVADRFLFLVAEGSTASCLDSMDGLPAGLLLHERVASFPAPYDDSDSAGNCWVLPPSGAVEELPRGSAVLAALRLAYRKYRAASMIT